MTGDQISSEIGGHMEGQNAVGKDIQQVHVTGGAAVLDPEQQAQLLALFAELRAEVEGGAPAELRTRAAEHVDELEEALTAEAPDLTTVQYVKQWFAKRLPQVAGALTAVLVHPLVGALVKAGGDALVGEFERIARD